MDGKDEKGKKKHKSGAQKKKKRENDARLESAKKCRSIMSFVKPISQSTEEVEISITLKWSRRENDAIVEKNVGTYTIETIDQDKVQTDFRLVLQKLDLFPTSSQGPDNNIPENSLSACFSDAEVATKDSCDHHVEVPCSEQVMEMQDLPLSSDSTLNISGQDHASVINSPHNKDPDLQLADDNDLRSVTEPQTLDSEQNISKVPNLEASSASSTVDSDLFISKPFQPDKKFVFPKTKHGQSTRSCLSKWFDGYTWLHYRHESNSVICYICANQFHKGNLQSVKRIEKAFISDGFKNWKDATEAFTAHQTSDCHTTAMQYAYTIPRFPDIVDLTDKSRAKLRRDERRYFIKVMEAVRFLGRQGIALRGRDYTDDNLTQLLLLFGKEDENMRKRLLATTKSRTLNKYTHSDYQNEILQLLAREVLADLLDDIRKSPYFSIMADEYTDVSNKEQLSLCVRWLDPETLNVYEDFLGFYEIPNIKSHTIVNVIKDLLIRLQLPLSKLRGQTYDGASNMLGVKSGVAAQMKELQPKALDTHCQGHSLNLSVKDVTTQCNLIRDTLGTAGEICVLVKYSPKREAMLGEIQKNIEFSEETSENNHVTVLNKLCPTRWTVRAGCYQKLLDTYDPLLELWDAALQAGKMDADVKARIIGCRTQMEKFQFYYGLSLSHKLYSLTDKLSQALQKKKRSAVSGQKLARDTIAVFRKMRGDRDADLLYTYVKDMAAAHPRIEKPSLGRRRNAPNYSSIALLDGCESTGTSSHPETPAQHFKRIYFEVIDTFINSLEERFESESYHIYSQLEQFLLVAIKENKVCPEGLSVIKERYSDDININALVTELPILEMICEDGYLVCFDDIWNTLRKVPEKLALIPNVSLLVMLLLVNPSTSSTPERSFSLARRLKTWTRSTMCQKRFNNLAILNCHQQRTDKINLLKVGNDFASLYNERKIAFGTFVPTDLQA